MIKMFGILPKKIKLMFALSVFILFLNIILTMFIPIFISQFLPLLITNNNQIFNVKVFDFITISFETQKNALNFLIVSLVLMIIFGGITSFLSLLIGVWAGENASNYYRDALYRKYQLLSLKDISTFSTESLMTRINDDVAVFWDFLIGASRDLVKAPLFIIIGLVFALMTDLNLTWTIVAVIPLLLFLMFFIFKKVHPKIAQSRKNLDNVTKEVNETISGARFIKAYNLQEFQYAKFLDANKKWLNNSKSIFSLFALSLPYFFFIVNLIVIFIYIGGYKIISNNPSQDIAQLIAKMNTFIEYEFFIAVGISMFSQFLGTFFRARVSSKRIMTVLDYKYDNLFVKNGLQLDLKKSSYGVKFTDFSFKYFDSSPEYVLENINFEIKPGQTLGIIGPTGSGKSTLVNLLINNMKYTQGSIQISDEEVNKINSDDLHNSVGIVYQEALLFSGTVRSNLLFAKENATEEEINYALDNACSKEFVYSFSDSLDHKIEQRGKNLSGGQKQRLSIARTLLKRPKILILDDTTSALDNITTKKVIENIKQNYKCTTIIISQKINSIINADNIIVMDKGKIINQGKHEELINSNNWYADIYKNQIEQ
ncbi:ABC transporter ATP-binding protein [Mycoplasma leonicaptivi]|uniref:ABC transporter ATP-binding protein n=1 Tax=Mycoplasma leonicaptivi TaxID=36742 RepID=UPI0004862CB2|nr:ABC transporter ATP-binding protein [Mycoplasma leonicaptivi]